MEAAQTSGDSEAVQTTDLAAQTAARTDLTNHELVTMTASLDVPHNAAHGVQMTAGASLRAAL